MKKAIKETIESVQNKVEAFSVARKGGGAGFQDCPSSLELNPEKTPWSAVFPLFGRLRRDASVEHMAGVSKDVAIQAFISIPLSCFDSVD